MKSTPEANANKNFRPLKLFLLKKKKEANSQQIRRTNIECNNLIIDGRKEPIYLAHSKNSKLEYPCMAVEIGNINSHLEHMYA